MPEIATNQAIEDAICDLLAEACDYGEEDAFLRRREHQRHTHAIRIEYQTDDNHQGVAGSLSDISGGGLALWIREKFDRGTRIRVRRWTEAGRTTWIPGEVQRCEHGLKGYRIGIRFERPVTFVEPAPVELPEEDLDAKKVTRKRRRKSSGTRRPTSALQVAVTFGLLVGSVYYLAENFLRQL